MTEFTRAPIVRVGVDIAKQVTQVQGVDARLIAAGFATAHRKQGTGGENDANDAAAIREAASRPTMRLVPVKTPVQQGQMSLHGLREGYKEERTASINRIRRHAQDHHVPHPLDADEQIALLGEVSIHVIVHAAVERGDLLVQPLDDAADAARGHRQPRALHRAHQAALVAAGGLHRHQVSVRGTELRDQLVPALGVVGHAPSLLAHRR